MHSPFFSPLAPAPTVFAGRPGTRAPATAGLARRPAPPRTFWPRAQAARRGAHASPPARGVRAAAAAGAGGGGAGAGLSRGPAQPRPAPPSGPPLRLAALSRRAPPPAPRSARLGRRRPPRLPGLEGCVGSRQGGGTIPPRGGHFAGTPGPATEASFRGPDGTGVGCEAAAPYPGTQPPAPLLLFPSPVPPPVPPPEGSHTLRAGRCRPRGGQRGRPGGRGLRPARAAAGGARRALAVDLTPAGRPARPGGGGRWAVRPGRGGPRGGPPPCAAGAAGVREGVADRSGGLGPIPPGR